MTLSFKENVGDYPKDWPTTYIVAIHNFRNAYDNRDYEKAKMRLAQAVEEAQHLCIESAKE